MESECASFFDNTPKPSDFDRNVKKILSFCQENKELDRKIAFVTVNNYCHLAYF